jgi:hypothetical protein
MSPSGEQWLLATRAVNGVSLWQRPGPSLAPSPRSTGSDCGRSHRDTLRLGFLPQHSKAILPQLQRAPCKPGIPPCWTKNPLTPLPSTGASQLLCHLSHEGYLTALPPGDPVLLKCTQASLTCSKASVHVFSLSVLVWNHYFLAIENLTFWFDHQ